MDAKAPHMRIMRNGNPNLFGFGTSEEFHRLQELVRIAGYRCQTYRAYQPTEPTNFHLGMEICFDQPEKL